MSIVHNKRRIDIDMGHSWGMGNGENNNVGRNLGRQSRMGKIGAGYVKGMAGVFPVGQIGKKHFFRNFQLIFLSVSLARTDELRSGHLVGGI